MGISIGSGTFIPDYNNKLANNPQNIINTDGKIQDEVKGNTAAGVREKTLEGVKECQTCKNRRYQDGSNDGGVSFQSPTKVDPKAAASAVRSHEQEHVSRNANKAKMEDRKVVASSVKIFTAICPECGKTYVSGGETRTTTAAKDDKAREADKTKNPGAPGLELRV